MDKVAEFLIAGPFGEKPAFVVVKVKPVVLVIVAHTAPVKLKKVIRIFLESILKSDRVSNV